METKSDPSMGPAPILGGEPGTTSGSGTIDSDRPARPGGENPGGRARRRRTLTIVTVIVLAAVISMAYLVTGGFHVGRGGTSEVTVISGWTYDSIPGGQYDAVAFVAHGLTRLNGTFTNSGGIIVYIMTPAQLMALNIKGTPNGFNWSSGPVHNLTLYGLNVTLNAGAWDLVLLNPDPRNATVVDFWTPVTASPV